MTHERGRQRGRRKRAVLLLVLLCGSAPFVHCGFRRDEVECEEAVSLLSSCCPDFDPERIDCTYDHPGCDSPSYPSLSARESECILGKSCEALAAQHACESLLARNNGGRRSGGADGSAQLGTAAPEPICR